MKQNITKIPDFDDLIFETRNKDYGAYQLRKNYKSAIISGLICAILIACLTIVIPFVIELSSDDILAYGSRYIQGTIDILEPPREELYIPPSPSPPELKKLQEIIKYVVPKIVDTLLTNENAQITNDEILAFTGDTLSIVNGTGTGNDILSVDFGSGLGDSYIIVEVMPSFMGGDLVKFREWVRKRTNYPQEAIDNKISGTVILTFIIEKDGSVSNVTVVKGVHPILDNEAVRVISESPKWRPGLQRGQPVRVIFTIPISFSPN